MSKETLIEIFKELELRFRHPPRGGNHSREVNAQRHHMYLRSQIELYHLAQVLTPLEVQARVDKARRAVVSHLLETQGNGSVFLHPIKIRRPIRWCEYMLTPELEGNLALTGSKIPYAVAKELQNAHRAQIEAIRRIVGI